MPSSLRKFVLCRLFNTVVISGKTNINLQSLYRFKISDFFKIENLFSENYLDGYMERDQSNFLRNYQF